MNAEQIWICGACGLLYDPAEAVRIAAVLLLPVMPSSAAEILRRLGETSSPRDLRLDTATAWRASGERDILNAGALWPRLEDKGAITVSETNPAAPAAPAAAEVSVTPTAAATSSTAAAQVVTSSGRATIDSSAAYTGVIDGLVSDTGLVPLRADGCATT